MEHLAIVTKGTIGKILRGEKTIESRFSVHRIAPYGRIQAGERVYLQETGKPVTASFEVERVLFFSELNEERIAAIRDEYGDRIHADEAFWRAKGSARYATLMFIRQAVAEAPFRVAKRDRSAFKSVERMAEIRR